MQYTDLRATFPATESVQYTPTSVERPAHGWWILPFAAFGLLAWFGILIGLWRILT